MPQPKLNPKQKRFAQEYVVDMNGTQAAIRAGYSKKTAGQIAERMLKKVEVRELVQAAVQKRDQRVEISQDRILLELERVAFGDVRSVVSWTSRSVTLIPSDKLTEDAAALIAEVSKHRLGVKVKLHDRLKALELLMRHKGMLNDKLALHIPPDSLGVATCEQKSLAARERLLALRSERESRTADSEEETHTEVHHEQDVDNG